MRILACTLAMIVAIAAGGARADTAGFQPRQAVVLIHGLGRTSGYFDLMSARLVDAGYAVCAVGYPSLTRDPEELVALLSDKIAGCPGGDRPRYFVTHSLGGILLRAWAATLAPEARRREIDRVVMLGPPHGGSPAADVFGNTPVGWFIGPTGRQLGTDADSLPNRLDPLAVTPGIVAGDRPVHVGSIAVDEPSDGLVPVDSTKLHGMRDHVLVDRSHNALGSAPEVIQAALSYLADGCFDLSIAGLRDSGEGVCARQRARRAALRQNRDSL